MPLLSRLPILGPVFINNLGVEPLHFAIIMCVNLTVGLVTPPVGLALFVASSLSGERVEVIARHGTDWNSMGGQYPHPHPLCDATGRWISFNAAQKGRSDVYVVEV